MRLVFLMFDISMRMISCRTGECVLVEMLSSTCNKWTVHLSAKKTNAWPQDGRKRNKVHICYRMHPSDKWVGVRFDSCSEQCYLGINFFSKWYEILILLVLLLRTTWNNPTKKLGLTWCIFYFFTVI